MRLRDTMNKISESIIYEKNFFEHRNILIIGENTAGKSKTISSIVKDLWDKEQPIYYICSWNRRIANKREEMKKTFKDIKPREVVCTRLESENFNSDVFTSDLGMELVMNELYSNAPKYTLLFKDYLGVEVSASSREVDNFIFEDSLVINNESFENLSDAQVSMMRILMEVNFAYENNCKYIFIDEFDINLDHINSGRFLEWLKEKYGGLIFIISAHSLYTVLNLRDFDIIKIKKNYTTKEQNLCVFFDSNDLDNVEIIDKKLFGNSYTTSEIDEQISSNLKSLLSHKKVDQSYINRLANSNKLTTKQKVVVNFIKERMGE